MHSRTWHFSLARVSLHLYPKTVLIIPVPYIVFLLHFFFLFDYTEIIGFCVKDHRVKVPFSLYDIKGPYNQRFLWYLMLSHLGEGVFVRCLLCTVTLFSPLSTLYSLEGCPIQNWLLRNKKNCVHCAFDWSIYIIHFELFCMRDSSSLLFINL